MHADERQMITDLFERMRSFGAVQKDHEAEQLIMSLARQNPDAGYMLVQSVLVQEQTIAAQQQQVEDMQARVQHLEQQLARSAPAPRQAAPQSGGFLGGIFGGGTRPAAQPQQRAGSVPAFGGQQQAAPSASPWGRGAGAQPMQPQGYQQGQAPQSAGGGFMRSAMATAAGVAGGMLAANAISGMLKGNNPASTGAENASSTNNDPASDQSYSQAAAEPSYQDPASNDPGYTDTGSDNSWDGGGDVEL